MTRALVITGDAARGAFQAGVLSALSGDFDAAYGTSSGAVNACLYAYAKTGEDIVRQWESIRRLGDVYAFNWLAALWRPGLYNSGPLLDLVRRYVERQGGPGRCKAVAVVTDTRTSETIYVDSRGDRDRYVESVAASATIPGLCCVAPHSEMSVWTDGGLRELAPITKAQEDGHDDVTLVLSRPWGQTFQGDWRPRRFPLAGYSSALRAIDLMLHEVAWCDILNGIDLVRTRKLRRLEVYAPAEPLPFGLLDFEPDNISRAVRAGIRAVAAGPVHVEAPW